MNLESLLSTLAAFALPTLFAITVHEAAHAYVASKLGDNTAKSLGRVSLNPKTHIDPLGTIAMPLLGVALGGFLFGWAKPVPVDQSRLRYGAKSMVWVALAGPASNFVMAIMWALIRLGATHGYGGPFSEGFAAMGAAGVQINMTLMIFNLLPLPPLDGSRVVARFLKGKAKHFWGQLEQYGMFVLLALMFTGVFALWMTPWMSLFSFIPQLANMR
jgi:Zn-dependent protease